MSVVEPVHDEKAGWSSMCRRGETRMCVTAGAACTNPKHGAKEARRPAAVEKEKPMPQQPEGLVWEEPPVGKGRHRRSPVSAEHEEALKAYPKRWAKVQTYNGRTSASTAAKAARDGRWGHGPEWEFVGRGTENGGSALYVRFVGTEAT